MTRPHEQLVILDFDNTLFNVGDFLADFGHVAEVECGIAPKKFHGTYESARKASGSYNGYDHLWLLGVSVKEAERILSPAFFRKDYTCPGVCGAIAQFENQADLVIWTLGHPRFQEFKRSLIPCLADIPLIAGEAAKSTFPKEIELGDKQAHYNGRDYSKLVMIDDHPRNFLVSPPSYMRQIRVRAPEGRYSSIETPQGVEEVSNISDISL